MRHQDERIPSAGQSNGVVRAQFDRAPAQSLRFRDLLEGVNDPAVSLRHRKHIEPRPYSEDQRTILKLFERELA